ncbi:MAG: hypothetical protein NZT92_07950 [Abditibacteriales bacterium]|nr:hypothetical protein [Abditibacteriales bacterium]MDW8367512.1 hypothetical protein [Abditibacteriales bacterium]
MTKWFECFSRHNLLEFKSPNDPLTVKDFHRILGRAYLYASEQAMEDPREMVVCILCPRKPVKLLTRSPQIATFERVQAGVYRCHHPLNVYVVVTAELPREPKNYPLLLFTSGQQQRKFLEELVRQRQIELLRIAPRLFTEAVEEVMPMGKGNRNWPTLEDNLKYTIERLGTEKVIALLPPEVRLAGLKGDELRKALEGVNRAELLCALADLEAQEQPPARPRPRGGKAARKRSR